MRFVQLDSSPLAPGAGMVRVHYRDVGTISGVPLLFLHGGWGYEIYPFDAPAPGIGDRFRVVIPDRTGYGASSRGARFTPDFHRRAAMETLAVMDTFAIRRAVLWGHSDGAVLAVHLALMAPERVRALVLEAFHFYRVKPRSRAFFETLAHHPESLGPRVTDVLAREHGDRDWRALLNDGGNAWLALSDQADSPSHDLYDGRLRDLRVPTMFLHGAQDPRTEPGELDAASHQVRGARVHCIASGGHSPHSERDVAADAMSAAATFLAEHVDAP